MIQESRAGATEPALEPFIEWSQGLRWDSLPEATRHMVKRERLDSTLSSTASSRRANSLRRSRRHNASKPGSRASNAAPIAQPPGATSAAALCARMDRLASAKCRRPMPRDTPLIRSPTINYSPSSAPTRASREWTKQRPPSLQKPSVGSTARPMYRNSLHALKLLPQPTINRPTSAGSILHG